MRDGLKQAEVFAFIAAMLIAVVVIVEQKRQENPPIVVLSEDREAFRFALGSARLPSQFRHALKEEILPRLEVLARRCKCDMIEIVGHTDGVRIASVSNFDRVVPDLVSNGDIGGIHAGSNVDLGMMRALSVFSFIRQEMTSGRLGEIDYVIPLSAGQMVEPSNRLADLSDERSRPKRRRIEIRLRQSAEMRSLILDGA